jgi:hypothetical protein
MGLWEAKVHEYRWGIKELSVLWPIFSWSSWFGEKVGSLVGKQSIRSGTKFDYVNSAARLLLERGYVLKPCLHMYIYFMIGCTYMLRVIVPILGTRSMSSLSWLQACAAGNLVQPMLACCNIYIVFRSWIHEHRFLFPSTTRFLKHLFYFCNTYSKTHPCIIFNLKLVGLPHGSIGLPCVLPFSPGPSYQYLYLGPHLVFWH